MVYGEPWKITRKQQACDGNFLGVKHPSFVLHRLWVCIGKDSLGLSFIGPGILTQTSGR